MLLVVGTGGVEEDIAGVVLAVTHELSLTETHMLSPGMKASQDNPLFKSCKAPTVVEK
jgi:hypothetical protein